MKRFLCRIIGVKGSGASSLRPSRSSLEKGFTLLEIIVSLALLGIIGVLFLQGAMTSAKARVQADERATSKVLAETIIDWTKKQDFAPDYTPTVPAGYTGYTIQLLTTQLSNDLQKIKVTVSHGSRQILSLENYKANR
jgi:prepilin-type N-terminal cleavage/methylation domain-containing protein